VGFFRNAIFSVGMADAYPHTVATTVHLNQSRVSRSILVLIALAAVALATSFARGEDHPVRATVAHSVQVKQVAGSAEYAYAGTGWQPLAAGKFLQAGASIRTGYGGNVILAMEERGSLVRVGPMRRLDLAASAPADGTSVTIVPVSARVRKTASAKEFAAE
jgi:hypothetical protein